MRTTCPTKTCRDPKDRRRGIKLHWELFAGMRLFREVDGRKVYEARCPNCKQDFTLDGGTGMSIIQSQVLRVTDKDNVAKHKKAKAGGYHEYGTPWAGYVKCIHCGHLTAVAVLEFAKAAVAAGKPKARSWTVAGGYR